MVLDCPPSLGLLTINALAVAQEVIIPMQPHFLALQGVGKFLETVALVSRRMNPGLKVSGIVLTMFDSQTKLSNEVVGDLKSFIRGRGREKSALVETRGFSPAGSGGISSWPKARALGRRFCNMIRPATGRPITGRWRRKFWRCPPRRYGDGHAWNRRSKAQGKPEIRNQNEANQSHESNRNKIRIGIHFVILISNLIRHSSFEFRI